MIKPEYLIEIIEEFYPKNIQCFDSEYDRNIKIGKLKSIITKKRKNFDVSSYSNKLNQIHPEIRFRDMTFLYETNPSIRFESIYKYPGSSVYISLLYPIFTIKGDLVYESKHIEKTINEFDLVHYEEIIKIFTGNISAGGKLAEHTTLFDCFFNDTE